MKTFVRITSMLLFALVVPLGNLPANGRAFTNITSDTLIYLGAENHLPNEYQEIQLANVMKLTAGSSHTCALLDTGRVKCWGANREGQLGNGSTMDRLYPTYVTGLAADIVSITGGFSHTCALTSGGGVRCWGDNDYGQLGDGTTVDRLTPVDVSGLTSGVVAISARDGWHTCAITLGGGVKCWGGNWYGQLGDGTTDDRWTPVDVVGLSSGVIAVVAGGEGHSCAVTSGGEAKCWGGNFDGQLGDGTTEQRITPVNVVGLTSGVTGITLGIYHTCALVSGGVKCWGYNGFGQIGDGTYSSRYTPVDVSGLTSGAIAVEAYGYRSCALTSGGGVKCWGHNFVGQMGDGTTIDRLMPVNPQGLTSGVTSLTTGGEHSCVLTSDNKIKCWGSNWAGQLGQGTVGFRSAPVTVSGLGGSAINFAAGGEHTCAVITGGGAKCWGNNKSGQLGDNTTLNRSFPTSVFGLTSGVASISADKMFEEEAHSCAVTSTGGAKCWGNNWSGKLGNGTNTSSLIPVDVTGLSANVSKITSGWFHTCALMSGGGAKCWGGNDDGQIGDGTTTPRLTPVDVQGLTSGVSQMSAGGYHTCALTSGGGVKCWGDNFRGQLGDGTNTTRLSAVNVTGLTSGVAAIAVGDLFSCALTSGGAVKCWGGNYRGQLGDGTTSNRNVPVNVVGLSSGVTAISAGSAHACALTSGGGVKCWGNNHSYQLGDGSYINRYTPVDVLGLSTGVDAISAGGSHTCAHTSGGDLVCWGDNLFGQLGDGTFGYIPTPVEVLWPDEIPVFLPAVSR